MRMYAYLNEPLKRDDKLIYKIMLFEAEEGVYLFGYGSPDAVISSSDILYENAEELHEEWDSLIDGNGWIAMEDPLPGCQHDAFITLRVKGRNTGKPEWGKYETFVNGEWIDYNTVI